MRTTKSNNSFTISLFWVGSNLKYSHFILFSLSENLHLWKCSKNSFELCLGIPNSLWTFSHLTYITFNNSRTISFFTTIICDWLWIVKKKYWFHVKMTNNISQLAIYNMYGKDCNPKNNSIVHSTWKIINWLITTHKEKHNIGTHHYQKGKCNIGVPSQNLVG